MNDEADKLVQRIAALEADIERLKTRPVVAGMTAARGVRKRSTASIFGLPLYDVAFGPDLERGELRGHAKGFFAFGDIADGVFAVGGLARGVFAFGGAAIGLLVAIGGGAIGAIAIGGGAIGVLAVGGGAIGYGAIGGGAVGYFACGGGAAGVHVIDPMQQDPAAVAFFSRWVPGFEQILKSMGR